ncbi:MAG TPA: hypothetical protein VGM88_10310 [Kofleriaceae bacterium]|jgi:hypothetical protein
MLEHAKPPIVDPPDDRETLDAILEEAQRTYETRATLSHEDVMAELQARRDRTRT